MSIRPIPIFTVVILLAFEFGHALDAATTDLNIESTFPRVFAVSDIQATSFAVPRPWIDFHANQVPEVWFDDGHPIDSLLFEQDLVIESDSETGSVLDLPLINKRDSIWHSLLLDQKNFYSADSVVFLSSCFVVGGLMANTGLDRTLNRHFQQSVRRASTDEWFEGLHANKELGNGRYSLPVYLLAMSSKYLPDDVFPKSTRTLSTWGERSMRGFIVGAPPLLAMQRVVGGSRPDESGAHSSHWRPLADNNGISGHSFMGSLPFITAAKMSENPWVKMTFYSGSLLAPLSRVNDEAHYPSQALLGWCIAYVAASAIDSTESPNRRWHVIPWSEGRGNGLAIERQW